MEEYSRSLNVLSPWKVPPPHPLDRRLSRQGAGLDAVEKKKKSLYFAGSRNPAVQLVIHLYTD
jgi:hypothetical protein